MIKIENEYSEYTNPGVVSLSWTAKSPEGNFYLTLYVTVGKKGNFRASPPDDPPFFTLAGCAQLFIILLRTKASEHKSKPKRESV